MFHFSLLDKHIIAQLYFPLSKLKSKAQKKSFSAVSAFNYRTTIHPPQTFPDFPNQFSVNIETIDDNNRLVNEFISLIFFYK